MVSLSDRTLSETAASNASRTGAIGTIACHQLDPTRSPGGGTPTASARARLGPTAASSRVTRPPAFSSPSRKRTLPRPTSTAAGSGVASFALIALGSGTDVCSQPVRPLVVCPLN